MSRELPTADTTFPIRYSLFAIRYSLFATHHSRQPMIHERGKPGASRMVMHGAVGEMGGARFCAREERAVVAAGGPEADRGVGDVGVELQRIGALVAEGLHRKCVA